MQAFIKSLSTIGFIILLLVGLSTFASATIALSVSRTESLLDQVSRLDHEITQALAAALADSSRQIGDNEYRKLVARYHMKIHRLENMAAGLDRAKKHRVLIALSKTRQRIDAYTQARTNAELRNMARLPVQGTQPLNVPGKRAIFSPEAGGSISGSVHDEETSAPIIGLEIDIYDASSDYVTSTYTDAYGNYQSAQLATGTYFVETKSYDEYLNELYDNSPCDSYCYAGFGTPVHVIDNTDTPNIDFLLQKAGSIAGWVTDDSTGASLDHVFVTVRKADGSWFADTYSDSDGYFYIPGLYPGQYVARTFGTGGHVDELFDNLVCEGYCNEASGTLITVAGGEMTVGIDFALSRGAGIKGKITDDATGVPISGADILIYDPSTYRVSEAFSNSHGNYNAGGLPPGNYFAIAMKEGYVSEYYENQPCASGWWCADLGTPITITDTGDVTGIDFALEKGGTIAGSVKSSDTQSPLQPEIEIFNELGDVAGYGYTDVSGKYAVTGLPTGVYYVATTTYSSYIAEIYDDIPWSGYNYPDIYSGTPVDVVAPETVQADFVLDRGGSISGSLTDSSTGLPVEGWVCIDVLNGSVSWCRQTDALGNHTTSGLNTGIYYAEASDSSGNHLQQLYDRIPCSIASCNMNDGTPISVTAGQDTGGIDFPLVSGGRFKGVLTDAATAAPLDSGYVDIYDSQGEYAAYGYTYVDLQGHYYISDALPVGQYYARASSQAHISELYDNLVCPWNQCDVLTGTPIQVIAGPTMDGIDFALSQGSGVISGTITDSLTGTALNKMQIRVYNAFSQDPAAYAYTDVLGHYTVAYLPAGSYFVKSSGAGHLAALYGGVPCPLDQCDPTTGTAVIVSDGGTVPGIDIALDRAGVIHGVATDERNGAPIENVLIDIFDSNGQMVHESYTDAAGSYTADDLPDGPYYARAYGMGFYAVELYDDIWCPDPECDPLLGSPITVNSTQPPVQADFSLAVSSGIRGLVRDAATGAGIEGVTVKFLREDGSLVATAQTVQHGIYYIYNLHPADYYAIAEGGVLYIDQLYKGIPCPGSACNLAQGTKIHLNGGTAQPINFNMSDSAFLYSDEFEDSQVPGDWTYTGPAWTTATGNLIGNAMLQKASAFAEPAYSGCTQCTFEFSVTGTGSAQGKIWLLGWHNQKSQVELLMKDQRDRWILKERVNGKIVQKAKALRAISQDTAYRIRMTYDGAHVLVFLDDDSSPLVTITPSSIPQGTGGVMAKGVTVLLDYLRIY